MKIPIVLCALFLGLLANGDEAIRFYEKGDFKHAQELFAKLSASAPGDPGKRLWLAKSYLKIQKWDDAIRELEKAVQLSPANALYRLWLGRACGMRASHSNFITAMGRARRVVREFEEARRLAPENLDIRFDLLSYYLDAPSPLGGGKDKAEAEVKAIQKLDPRKGHTARAILLEKNKQWDLARQELIQSAVEFAGSADAYNDLAYFLLSRNDNKNALQNAQKALSLDGASKHAKLLEAAAKIRILKELPETEKMLQELAAGPLNDDDPAFEEVYYWLGECRLAQNNKDKAREAFRSAITFDPYLDKAKKRLDKLR